MEFYQTGDVLYIKENELPKNAIEIKTDIFHKGENHTHKVRGDFSIHESGSDLFLECRSECELYHEEHKTLIIPKGVYKKAIVMEYDHILEESREVID